MAHPETKVPVQIFIGNCDPESHESETRQRSAEGWKTNMRMSYEVGQSSWPRVPVSLRAAQRTIWKMHQDCLPGGGGEKGKRLSRSTPGASAKNLPPKCLIWDEQYSGHNTQGNYREDSGSFPCTGTQGEVPQGGACTKLLREDRKYPNTPRWYPGGSQYKRPILKASFRIFRTLANQYSLGSNPPVRVKWCRHTCQTLCPTPS